MSETRTVFKYGLKPGLQRIRMPKGARILCVQAQRGEPHLWALVDVSKEEEARVFQVFATGEPIAEDMGQSWDYLGTFQLEGGVLVFHAFEYTGV